MRMQQKTIDITRTGVVETTAFQIKASAKAFQILSSGLYSDKIRAIIRELSSNAYDAHVDAGTNKKPFDVHLPNSLEPWFSIRDYGIGLSHKDVMTLYSTYFASTKSDSNDATGMLGLGSKSPFSYTEAFTVISYFNGEQRTYLIDIGEEGVPQISLVEGFPINTTAHNGLEIQFAVKTEDFRDFEKKAELIYLRYDPCPNVVGVANFEVPKVTYLFKGKGWRLIDSRDTGHYAKSFVIQGTVAYPVDLSAMRNVDSNSYEALFGMNLEMDFPIGELDVAANRETLSYDERTITNLVKRADLAKKELAKKLSAKFKACSSLWEARKLWVDVFGDKDGFYGNALGRLVKSMKLEITWHGKKISSNVRIDMTEDLSMDAFNVKNLHSRFGNRVKMRRYAFGRNNHYLNITASDKIKFFVDDLDKGAVARVRNYVDESKGNEEIYMVRPKTAKALKELTDLLGGATFQNASDLPKPTRKNNSSGGGPMRNGCVFSMPSDNYRVTLSDFWTNTMVDFKAGGYYLPVNRFKVQVDGNVFNGDLYEIMKRAKELKIFDYTTTAVFGVAKSAIPHLKGNWVNLFDYIVDGINKITSDSVMAKSVAKSKAYVDFFNEGGRRTEETICAMAKLMTGEDNLINTLSDLIVDTKKNDNYQSLRDLANQLSTEIDSVKKVKQVSLLDVLKQIVDTYPMLTYPLGSYQAPHGQALQKLVDYVGIVDKTVKLVVDSE